MLSELLVCISHNVFFCKDRKIIKSLQINFGGLVYPLNPVKSLATPNHEERVTNFVLAKFNLV